MLFSAATYADRRAALCQKLGTGIALFPANDYVGRNYLGNTYSFRQDSNFLYYGGLQEPNVALLIDAEANKTTLYGEDRSLEDMVWEGPHPSLAERAERIGAEDYRPLSALAADLAAFAEQQRIHYLPPYRPAVALELQTYLQVSAEELRASASLELTRAVIAQRSYKSAEEVADLERAVTISGRMHTAVMKAARPGMTEAELAGLAHGIAVQGGGDIAYGIILTTQGQTLHNHRHTNVLAAGDLVLGDFGAETALRYAGDITRTFPVSARFDERQRALYELVLRAETEAIEAVRPGVAYRDLHLGAARTLATGLKDMGLMRGDVDEAVAAGAHALFFPHGLGHMIGLDVHDMEGLGEDHVGYSETVRRSEQFGMAYLRLGRELEPGFVLTVEPGLYFIPELINQWEAARKFDSFIDYDALADYRHFGGIRIEDNVLVTETGHRVLGAPIPKTVAAVEALRGEAT